MRASSYQFGACLFFASFGAATLSAQISIEQAVVAFDTHVNHFNVLTAQNLTLSNTHTDGAIATAGNLTLNSSTDIVLHSQKLGSGPSIYVGGQLNVSGNNNKLLAGTAYIPNFSQTTTWNNPNNANQKWLVGSGGQLDVSNSSITQTSLVTPPAMDWNINTALAELASASAALAQASATGTLAVSGDTLLLNTTQTSGVAIFNLDANDAASWSGLNIGTGWDIPDDMVYVINVFNADGKTLFAGNNGNNNSDFASRLLWNIVPDNDSGTASSVTFGSNLYGSVLAPLMDLTSNGTYLNGQIVSNSFYQSGAEVHHIGFDASSVTFSAVPEPRVWGLAGLGLATVVALLRRRRPQAVAQD